MKRFLAISCVISLLFSVLCGCAPGNASESGKAVTVVFVPKITGNAFFEAANKGAQAYAEQQSFLVDYRGDPEADVSKQIAIIEQAIRDKVDAICVSSLDATALDDVMKKAMAAGIKVVTWDSDVSGDARSIMVSQGTPEQLGRMLVEMGAKSLTSRGKNPTSDEIRYAWHYSQSSVADQNSWRIAGENYIQGTYPTWKNIAPDNYYSEQNAELSVTVGEAILTEHPDVDLIICNDSTALPGQAKAAQNKGLTAQDVTITGFASPNSMREYCKAGTLERWGLWDCQVQGALGCYIAYYLASGHELKVGERLDVPDIGIVEVMPNTVLDAGAFTSDYSGVVLLPNRTEFTIENVDHYDF